MRESIKIDWEILGAELADLSDDEQGDFFRGFIREVMKYDTHFKRESQFISIGKKLSDTDRDNMSELFSAIWYKE